MMALGCVVAAISAYWCSAWPQPTDSRRPAASAARPELAPITVVPRVHLLGRLFPSAAYLIETSAGLVLVDAGLDADAASLSLQVADLGIDLSGLKAILLTHTHGDHCLGARHLSRATGAKVYAGKGDCDVLRAGGPREAMFAAFDFDDVPIHATKVDVELTGGEVIQVGDAQFQAISTPGHTPGSICYLLRLDGHRIMFTGDTVISFFKAGPHTGLGTYTAYMPPRYRGSASDYLVSLQKLLAIRVPDLVLPGHPRADKIPQSPRLTQRQWESLLNDGIVEMQVLMDRYQADGADFLDGNPKQLLPDLYYLGHLARHAVYVVAGTSGLLLLGAPGGADLPTFVASRLRSFGVEPAPIEAVLLTSCGPEATSGLDSLVKQTGCTVVAPREGLDSLAPVCPPDTRLVDLNTWFPNNPFGVKPLPLEGYSAAPAAYYFQVDGKDVLVTGEVPMTDNGNRSRTTSKALAVSQAHAEAYLHSLRALRQLKPDLWLPAQPLNGQNANLYDEEWSQVIYSNERIAVEWLDKMHHR